MLKQTQQFILTKGKVIFVLIGMSLVSVACYDKVANVHEYQYSSFVHDPEKNIVLNLADSGSSEFRLYVLNNNTTMVMQSPEGKVSKEVILEATLTEKTEASSQEDSSDIVLKKIVDNQSQENTSKDIYQLLDDELINNGAKNIMSNKSNNDMIFLNADYDVSIKIDQGNISISSGDFDHMIYYQYGKDGDGKQVVVSNKIGASINNIFSDNKGINEGYIILAQQGIEGLDTQQNLSEQKSTSLGDRFLKLDIHKTNDSTKKPSYKITIIEYKIIDNPSHADNIEVLIPSETNLTESFLIPKDKKTIIFSKNQPEEGRFFSQLINQNIIRENKLPQGTVLDVVYKDEIECKFGENCIDGALNKTIKEEIQVSEEHKDNVVKLHEKAVGHSILSTIDAMNQRLYVTGVILDESSNSDNNKNQASETDKYQETESNILSLPVNNQHLGFKMADGTEYALRPVNKYLAQYIDGSRYGVYSLSKSAINYLNTADNPDQKAIYTVQLPPQEDKPIIFLAGLKYDNQVGNLDNYDIHLMVNGRQCEGITFTNNNEDDATGNKIFVQPLADKKFGLVHIENKNIAYCQYGQSNNNQLATAPFELKLPIGICNPSDCHIFRADPKSKIGMYQNKAFWYTQPIDFYRRKSTDESRHQVNSIKLADGFALWENDKFSGNDVRDLGLTALVGGDKRFNNHLLGMSISNANKHLEDITLSIRRDAQEILQEAVDKRLEVELNHSIFKQKHQQGYGNAQVMAVAMNAKTGEILAAADSRKNLLDTMDLAGIEAWDNDYPHTTKYLRWLPAYKDPDGKPYETTGSTIKLLTSLSILDYITHHKDKANLEKLVSGISVEDVKGYAGYPVNFLSDHYPATAQHPYVQVTEVSEEIRSGQIKTVSMPNALMISNNTYFAWLHEMMTPALLQQPPNERDDNAGILSMPMSSRQLSQYTIANGKTIHKMGYNVPINLLTGMPEQTTATNRSWILSPMTLDVYQGKKRENKLLDRAQVRRAGIGIGRVHLTPIHLASLSASISQGKTIYPRITAVSDDLPIYRMENQEQDLLWQLQNYQINKKPSLQYIIQGMHQTATGQHGTARKYLGDVPSNSNVCVYVKTGTAPISGNGESNQNASITGFAYERNANQCSHDIADINESEVISFACVIRHTNASGGNSCGELMAGFLGGYFSPKVTASENNNEK